MSPRGGGGGGDLCRARLGPRGVDLGDLELRAVLREEARNGRSDAGAPTRHHGYAPVQQTVPVVDRLHARLLLQRRTATRMTGSRSIRSISSSITPRLPGRRSSLRRHRRTKICLVPSKRRWNTAAYGAAPLPVFVPEPYTRPMGGI